MRAISLTIQALRGIARWGTGDMLQSAFTGFQALTAPEENKNSWREILGFSEHEPITSEDIERRYRSLRSQSHPDKGGSNDAFIAIQRAYKNAMADIGRLNTAIDEFIATQRAYKNAREST